MSERRTQQPIVFWWTLFASCFLALSRMNERLNVRYWMISTWIVDWPNLRAKGLRSRASFGPAELDEFVWGWAYLSLFLFLRLTLPAYRLMFRGLGKRTTNAPDLRPITAVSGTFNAYSFSDTI